MRVPRAHRHEVVRFQEVEAAVDGRRADEGGAAAGRDEARMDGRGVAGEAAEPELRGKTKPEVRLAI